MVDNKGIRKSHQVIVALGGNLGDSKRILTSAVERLKAEPGIQAVRCSSWYRTPPIGPPQPDYCNGCIWLSCQKLTPHELLMRLQRIELQYGRERNERWGARTLDLDIIFFDDQIIDESDLTIPHPRMRERAFVLVPLMEIAPDWIDPRSGQSVAALYKQVATDNIVKIETSEMTSG